MLSAKLIREVEEDLLIIYVEPLIESMRERIEELREAEIPDARGYRRAFVKDQKVYKEITREGIRDAKILVAEVQAKILADLNTTEFNQANLPALRTAVDEAMNEYEARFAGSIGALQNPAFQNGIDMVDDPLEAIGISLALPNVSTQLLATATSFSADYIKNVSDETKARINAVISRGLLDGSSVSDVSKKIRDILSKAPPIVQGAGRKYSLKYRSESIARSELSRAHDLANRARLAQSAELVPGLQTQWIAQPDHCPQCEPFAGEIYDIGAVPETIPVHPNCYSIDTEILTINGFKFIKDIKIGEKVISLNPINFQLEYIKTINKISYKSKKMIHFYSRNFDMLVTPNHNMFVLRRERKYTKKRKWEFIEARNIISESRFFRSSNWIGKSSDKILGFNSEAFMKFLGFYLSEGSASRSPEIQISQDRIKNFNIYLEIVNTIEQLECKPYLGSQAVSFRNKKLFDYVSKLGKCNEKYIPFEIKQKSSWLIRQFLDAYIAGDGHIKPGKKNWKGGNFRDERLYFTVSKKLADDIGEMILKVGRRPSFSLRKNKGKISKFKNGFYKSNYDLWAISECYGQTSIVDKTGIKINEILYNKEVACIELEKNHTLYVRRNGKCAWSGNCQCFLIPYKEEWVK